MKIKICGLRQPRELDWARELGADLVGFNFYPASPRYLAAEALEKMAAAGPGPLRAGVFVNPGWEELGALVRAAGLDLVQLHGDQSPDFCRRVRSELGRPVIKAFRLGGSLGPASLAAYLGAADYFLLDGGAAPGLYGGGGRSFPWDLAAPFKALGVPFFLAGGLTPENVAAAIERVAPYGVDVASGVESAPGRKSRFKMEAFIRAARSAAGD